MNKLFVGVIVTLPLVLNRLYGDKLIIIYFIYYGFVSIFFLTKEIQLQSYEVKNYVILNPSLAILGIFYVVSFYMLADSTFSNVGIHIGFLLSCFSLIRLKENT
ncbi:MAG: hypothetical protein R8G66_25440 [Cytophagales bacterium]|nr:hypothetical protein [Cytophagales bacterium]